MSRKTTTSPRIERLLAEYRAAIQIKSDAILSGDDEAIASALVACDVIESELEALGFDLMSIDR